MIADAEWQEKMRLELESKRQELTSRLERITANLRRGLEPDSKERAKQLEDREVVDALGNEAREELTKISMTLQRMQDGEFGHCVECGGDIRKERLEAYPYATACIDCASMQDVTRANPHIAGGDRGG